MDHAGEKATDIDVPEQELAVAERSVRSQLLKAMTTLGTVTAGHVLWMRVLDLLLKERPRENPRGNLVTVFVQLCVHV